MKIDDGNNAAYKKLSAQDGMQKMASCLSTPGNCLRLTGLSGVGKTRLVQALFDERYLVNPLDQTLAVYTDISDSPDPNQVAFVLQKREKNDITAPYSKMAQKDPHFFNQLTLIYPSNRKIIIRKDSDTQNESSR